LAALPPARPAAVAAATVPYAARGDEAARGPLHLSLAVEPRASIVIPAVNGFARTYACLASILERTGDVPYEVIVVDDASTDETRHLERVVTGVRVVRNAANCGFIEACNRGAEATRGEFLVFLNNDTFVSQGWLAQLLEPFGSSGEGEVGLVGAKLVYPDGRLQEAGGIVFADGSGWNYGRERRSGQPQVPVPLRRPLLLWRLHRHPTRSVPRTGRLRSALRPDVLRGRGPGVRGARRGPARRVSAHVSDRALRGRHGRYRRR